MHRQNPDEFKQSVEQASPIPDVRGIDKEWSSEQKRERSFHMKRRISQRQLNESRAKPQDSGSPP